MLIAVLLTHATPVLAAPPSGNTGSVTWPWLLGLAIVIVLVIAGLLRRMRRPK